MQAIDFEQARISWTTNSGIDGSWRVVAAACREGSEDCIYLAPAVMSGDVFGAGRLPRDPPYSYQLVATRKRHAIVREGETPEHRDNEADHEAAFSSFDIHAPRREAMPVAMANLDAATVARRWPLAARLKLSGQRGEFWILEFPVNHINTRKAGPAALQAETGPVLIPRDAVDIAGATVIGGCYLAYLFLNKPNTLELLAWGTASQSHRSFSRFARIEGIEAELLGGKAQG